MDRLLREGNPPTGQLASPKPQYKDVQTNNWEELKGEGGASYVKDKDVFAKLEQARALLDAISGKDFATQTTLAAVLTKLADLESELATIKANQLSGDQKVTLKDASGAVVSPATEAKLEQVRALLSGVATENKLEQARTLLEAISTKDFATSSKQDALKIAVEDLKSELNLVKSELANIKANQLSGDQKVQLSGTTVETILDRTFDISKDYGPPSYHRRWVTREGPAQWSTTLPAYDISRYKKLTIVIVNETSAGITFPRSGDNGLRYYFSPGPVSLTPRVIITLPEVPAGATAMWYDEMEALDVAENFASMGLLFTHDITGLTSGTVRFIICGVKR